MDYRRRQTFNFIGKMEDYIIENEISNELDLLACMFEELMVEKIKRMGITEPHRYYQELINKNIY